MLKQVTLLTKRPGMSMDEFKDYYENRHAPLVAPLLGKALRYVRRYVRPEPNSFVDQQPVVPCDCMMELWWENSDDFEAAMRTLGDPETIARIKDDENNIFAGHRNPSFMVTESESPMRGFEHEAAGDGFRCYDGREGTMKLVFLLTKNPDMSTQEFRAYYDRSHRKLGEAGMPKALRYVRRFVEPIPNPVAGETVAVPFDVITEIWCESRADWDATLAEMMESGMAQKIYEDEKKLFASHANPAFTVEEAESPMRGW